MSGTKIDKRATQRFLEALDPDAVEFTFQTFSDSDKLKVRRQGRIVGPHARTIRASFRHAAGELAEKNRIGVGVFVTINATSGRRRTLANFDRPRALFADLDGVPMPKWPMKPSIIVESSKGKFHCYWLINGDMSLDIWRGCMDRIVDRYGADRSASDPVRVLRLPGFFHSKGKPSMVKLIDCNGRRYTTGALAKAFPPIKRKKKRAQNTQRDATIDIGALTSALAHLTDKPHPRAKSGETYADDYETWVRFGLAIKRGLGDDGFKVWTEWARSSERYPGQEKSREKWQSFDVDSRSGSDAVTVGTVFAHAKRHGWSFTKYKFAALLAQVPCRKYCMGDRP